MRWKPPLFLHVLAWFLFNLLVLLVLAYGIARWRWQSGMESFVAAQAQPRLQAMAAAVAGELRVSVPENWPDVLERMGAAFGVDLHLLRADGSPEWGVAPNFPREVQAKLEPMLVAPRAGPGPLRWHNNRMGGPDPVPPERELRRRGPMHLLLFQRAGDAGYWAVLSMPMTGRDLGPGPPRLLVVQIHNPIAGGWIADWRPWLWASLAALAVSAVIWWPFVHGIKRRMYAINRAAARMADGEFDVALHGGAVHELAVLSESIQVMAGKLHAHITGQKRFLGDVAHELCSPLARMEVGIGVLSQRLEGQAEAESMLADLREDVRELAGLTNELLSFSKTSLAPADAPLESVPLRQLITEVATREAVPELNNQVSADCVVEAHPDLLRRAVANVLRNAIRHAGGGPIEVSATSLPAPETGVHLVFADTGPGVPDEALSHLFEPFYRVDDSRTRATGGTGLGLAIVQTCIRGCGGRVSVQNRQPHGLAVHMQLRGS